MRHLKPGTVEEQAAELAQIIGGNPYTVVSAEPRGLQIAVVIPFGMDTGIRLWWAMVRMFARSAWRELA